MKIKGKVGRSDLEGGFLTISDGKTTYKLEGGGQLAAGATVEVEGSVEQGFGIGFGMPTLRVKKCRVVD